MRPFKVIVVGAGYIAQAEQIPGWLHLNPGSIAAFVGRREEALSHLTAAVGVPGFTSLDEALDHVHADAVHICTPPWAREELISTAASRGLHILVEKPLALDSTTAQRFVDVAERAGVTLMVAAPRAYDTGILHACDLIREGRFGETLALESSYRLALPPVYDVLSPSQGISNAQYETHRIPRHVARLLDSSIHHLGLFRFWSSETPVVRSVERIDDRILHVSLRLGDVVAWHTNTGDLVHDERFGVYTSEGLISVRLWSPHHPWVFGRTEIIRRTGERIEPALARTNGYWAQLKDFVDTCNGGGLGLRVPTDAVDDLRLIEQILEVEAGSRS